MKLCASLGSMKIQLLLFNRMNQLPVFSREHTQIPIDLNGGILRICAFRISAVPHRDPVKPTACFTRTNDWSHSCSSMRFPSRRVQPFSRFACRAATPRAPRPILLPVRHEVDATGL